ncbi:MAG TPA: hypothetical protein VHP61_03170 [Acidobacteriota bacterium]|nr:hypothetical protein [Acidobacteriota bacterium]
MPRSFVTDIPRRKFLELGLKGGFAAVAAPTFRVKLMQIGGE